MNGNGDSSGFHVRIYDGHSKVWREVNVVVQNSGGTNYPKVTVEGGGDDVNINVEFAYVNRSGAAQKTDFYLVPTSNKAYTQLIFVDGFIERDTGHSSTSSTNINLDTAIGIYKAATDDSSKIGIGTTDPTEKLEVIGDILINGGPAGGRSLQLKRTGATNPWKLVQGHTQTDYFEILEGSDTRFLIKNGGNVGIGTNAPAHKLDVSGSARLLATAPTLTLQDSDESNVFGQIIESSGVLTVRSRDGSNHGEIRFERGNGSAVLETARFDSSGNTTLSGNLTVQGDISTTGTFTIIDTDVSTTEQLVVTNDGTGPAVVVNQKGVQPVVDFQDDSTSVFYIKNGGNVGIGNGITNPLNRLHVETSDSTIARFRSTTNKAAILIQDDDTDGYFSAESGRVSMGFNSGLHADNINILESGSNYYVGIGTVSPVGPLTLANVTGGNWNDGLIIDDPTGWAATVYKRSNSPKMFTGLYTGNDNYIWMSTGYSNSGTSITAPRADAVLMARPSTDDLQIYLETHFGNRIGVGTTSPAAILDIVDSQTQSGSAGRATIQTTATTTTTSTQSSGMYAIQNYFNLTGTGGSFQNSAHQQVMTTVSSTGTVTGLKNHISRVHTSGSGQINNVSHYNIHTELDGNGTISNWMGYAVADGTLATFTNSGHTITNTYGLYIGDITSGTQTNTPYGVYQASTDMRNYFGGNVGIGVTSPPARLTVRVDGNADTDQLRVENSSGRLFSVDNEGDVKAHGSIFLQDNGKLIATRKLIARDANGLLLAEDSASTGIAISDAGNTTVQGVLTASSHADFNGNATFISESKLFKDGTINSTNDVTSVVAGNDTVLFSNPVPRTHHDLLAFNSNVTQETHDGTSWSSSSLHTELFDNKEDNAITAISSSQSGVRWTVTNFAYTGATHVQINNTYSSGSGGDYQVTIESSSDGTNWTQRHQSTVSIGAIARFFRVPYLGGDSYGRITIYRSSGTRNINLVNVRWSTNRAGDQGQGREYERPYDWNYLKSVKVPHYLHVGNDLSTTMSSSNAKRLVVGDGYGAEGITIYSGHDSGGYLYFADGTAGDASYRGSVQYSHSTNAMSFHTAGTATRMFINSTGGIGLGTSSINTGIGLQVANGSLYVTNGTAYVKHLEAQYFGNGTELKLSAGQSADLKLMHYNTVDLIIKSDGKVGINDTAPQGKLQIDAGGDVNAIHLVNSGQNSSNFATRPISIIFGDEQKGASARHQASINCVREAWSSTPAALTFKTATGVNTATERMRITSGGNVGIDTTAPTCKLQVDEYTVGSNGNQDSGIATAAIFTNSGSDGLYLGVKNASYPNRGYAFKVTSNGVNSDFTIREHGLTGDRFTIKTGGNVGIGTSGPQSKFHVSGGDIRIDNNQQYLAETAGGGVIGVAKMDGSDNLLIGDGNLKIDVTGTTPRLVIDSSGDVGIGTTTPSEKLDVTGITRIGSSSDAGHLIGSKINYAISNTFSTGLTVTLANHRACHVKIFISGDWSNHSSIAYVGEFFIQNTANIGSYNEPGIILTEHDNLPSDQIESKIVDGTEDSFEIQFRTSSQVSNPIAGKLCYHVMGDASAVS
tara:strand:- start:3731 stop:8458 length:4728 start_codon:yes stop_codon:yes gene_type:complete